MRLYRIEESSLLVFDVVRVALNYDEVDAIVAAVDNLDMAGCLIQHLEECIVHGDEDCALPFYEAQVGYRNDDGAENTQRVKFHSGRPVTELEKELIKEVFDERLRSSSCSPICRIERIEDPLEEAEISSSG